MKYNQWRIQLGGGGGGLFSFTSCPAGYSPFGHFFFLPKIRSVRDPPLVPPLIIQGDQVPLYPPLIIQGDKVAISHNAKTMHCRAWFEKWINSIYNVIVRELGKKVCEKQGNLRLSAKVSSFSLSFHAWELPRKSERLHHFVLLCHGQKTAR